MHIIHIEVHISVIPLGLHLHIINDSTKKYLSKRARFAIQSKVKQVCWKKLHWYKMLKLPTILLFEFRMNSVVYGRIDSNKLFRSYTLHSIKQCFVYRRIFEWYSCQKCLVVSPNLVLFCIKVYKMSLIDLFLHYSPWNSDSLSASLQTTRQ